MELIGLFVELKYYQMLSLVIANLLFFAGIAVCAIWLSIKAYRWWFLVTLLIILPGCSVPTAFLPAVSNVVLSDIQAFQDNAQKYGTPQDLQCATFMNSYFQAMHEIIKDDSGHLLAFAYRGVISHRLALEVEAIAMKECGSLLAEIATAVARFRR
jgi:hypothetical protein